MIGTAKQKIETKRQMPQAQFTNAYFSPYPGTQCKPNANNATLTLSTPPREPIQTPE